MLTRYLWLNCFIFSQAPIIIGGTEIPLMLAGDAAYPSLSWLIKPYPGIRITPAEESFNCYLSSSRIVVENAFGRLKARWRMINKKLLVRIEQAPKVISACCIQTPEPDDMPPMVTESSGTQLVDNQANHVRDIIKCHLAQNYPLRKSNF